VLEHEVALEFVEPLQHSHAEADRDDLGVHQKIVLDTLECARGGSAGHTSPIQVEDQRQCRVPAVHLLDFRLGDY
ncbi:uncharacterized protein METZ01_LOCUS45506, partial [marine metagenome]